MRIAYLFTRFPVGTETFLQREVTVLLQAGVDVSIFSLWGGGGEFAGVRVRRLRRRRLATLLWRIPREAARHPGLLREVIALGRSRPVPSWLNFWENLLGAAFALCESERFRRDPPDLVHAVWATAPAAAGWLLQRLTGVPYTMGAHAFDLFEHGGDWLLREKALASRLVHTSTEMGRERLLAAGVPPDKIAWIRRGLAVLPECKPLRRPRAPLRIVCNARLVEKKGFDRQIAIYAALRAAGYPFEARIFGEGPLRRQIAALIRRHGLERAVVLRGHRPQPEIQENLAWADILVHTGVVAESGDRDGLPNAIPEAMAAGTLVVASGTAAVGEAVQDGVTGLIADVSDPKAWVAAIGRLAEDDALAERIRCEARRWVEEHFDGTRNTGCLLERFRRALS